MTKADVKIFRTKGAVAMSNEAFLAEIEKPVARIKLNMALFREHPGYQFKVGSYFMDEVDPQEEYETLREAIMKLADVMGFDIESINPDAAESFLCTAFLEHVGNYLKDDVAKLIQHTAVLSVALRDEYTELAVSLLNKLPPHLQQVVTEAEEALDRELAKGDGDEIQA